jgi:hypothetical protein
MMVIGMPGLTDAQNRVHMALWAMSGAPLIVGADLTTLSEATRATLTNREVLVIDQDALGLQAAKVAEPSPGLEVWSKPLSAPGQRAVLLLNRTDSAAPIVIDWQGIGLLEGLSGAVEDVWKQTRFADAPMSSYSATVPAQDATLLLVTGTEAKPTLYKPLSNGNSSSEKSAIKFTGVLSKYKVVRIDITYENSATKAILAELRTNGQVATRIAFPPTASGTSGVISIQAVLNPNNTGNTLTLSPVGDSSPSIKSIAVH